MPQEALLRSASAAKTHSPCAPAPRVVKQYGAEHRESLRLTPQEAASLDAFIAAPKYRRITLSAPLTPGCHTDAEERAFDIERYLERRFAAQQVRQTAFRLSQENNLLAIRAQDLFAGPWGTGVIPPNVRIIGDVYSKLLSPYALFPQNMFVQGSLLLDADHLAPHHAAHLPTGLTVTQNLTLTCRSQGPSFVLGPMTSVGYNLRCLKSDPAAPWCQTPLNFWDIECLGNIRVGGDMLVWRAACTLGANSEVLGNVGILGCRLPAVFPMLHIGGSLECNGVLGLTQLGLARHGLTVKGSIMLAGCPDLTHVGWNVHVGGNLSLYGNGHLTALPHPIRLRGDLILFGNRIAKIPNFSSFQNLIVHNEPLREVGCNVTARGHLYFMNLPYFEGFGNHLFVNGNVSLFACQKLLHLPLCLAAWPLSEERVSDFETLCLPRELKAYRTGLTLGELRRFAEVCSGTRIIPLDHDDDFARLEMQSMFKRALFVLRKDCFPTLALDIAKHEDLECSVTLDGLEDLVARNTAVALGTHEQLRVYDYHAFLRAWCLDGRDPATRQLVTPYELRRVIPLPGCSPKS